jgi:DNA-directed RNA polymerase specialized sigma24 family protein
VRTTRPVDDQPGHEVLVDAHRGRLLRLCRLLLRDPEEAKDVVQDVFMQAYKAQTQSGLRATGRPG